MITTGRLARVLRPVVITALAVAISGVASSDTVAVEKALLLVPFAGCLAVAAKVSAAASLAQVRLRRR